MYSISGNNLNNIWHIKHASCITFANPLAYFHYESESEKPVCFLIRIRLHTIILKLYIETILCLFSSLSLLDVSNDILIDL